MSLQAPGRLFLSPRNGRMNATIHQPRAEKYPRLKKRVGQKTKETRVAAYWFAHSEASLNLLLSLLVFQVAEARPVLPDESL